MKKRLFILALLLTVTLVFAACSGKNDKKDSEKTENTETETETEESKKETIEESTEEAKDDSEETTEDNADTTNTSEEAGKEGDIMGNTLLYQVPGGMLSNLISQLKQANAEDKYYDVLAEVPRVRKDFGYPPLVTPTSQIVGSQAVLNVLAGERYKMFTKESKAVLHGEYGALPGEVNEEVRRKAIGDEPVITCRPADLLKPELDKYREEVKDVAIQEEDVLSYALFPQVAMKFFENRKNGVNNNTQSVNIEKKAENKNNSNEVIELYVEDLTE